MENIHGSLADPQPDLALLLPREVFGEIILILRAALPPPLVDAAEDWARRDRVAMAAVASLLPGNGAEGRLAAQFVAADAQAMDCLRLAQEQRADSEVARRCTAQAASMMRQSRGAMGLLLRLQAARRKIAEDAVAEGRAEWTEHCAMAMMAEALVEAGPRAVVAKSGQASIVEIGSLNSRRETPARSRRVAMMDAGPGEHPPAGFGAEPQAFLMEAG